MFKFKRYAIFVLLAVILCTIVSDYFNLPTRLALWIQNYANYKQVITISGVNINRPNNWVVFFEKNGLKEPFNLYGLIPIYWVKSDLKYAERTERYFHLTNVSDEDQYILIANIDSDTNEIIKEGNIVNIQKNSGQFEKHILFNRNAVVIDISGDGSDYVVHFPEESVVIYTESMDTIRLFE